MTNFALHSNKFLAIEGGSIYVIEIVPWSLENTIIKSNLGAYIATNLGRIGLLTGTQTFIPSQFHKWVKTFFYKTLILNMYEC